MKKRRVTPKTKIPALEEALIDKSRWVRREAAQALWAIGGVAFAVLGAILVLILMVLFHRKRSHKKGVE